MYYRLPAGMRPGKQHRFLGALSSVGFSIAVRYARRWLLRGCVGVLGAPRRRRHRAVLYGTWSPESPRRLVQQAALTLVFMFSLPWEA